MESISSSSSVSSFYTENGVTRLNGSELMSGLDTQKLIDAMTSSTQSKIDKQNSLEQIAAWRREMYRSVESLMQKLSDDYFSYSSSTNLLSSSFFDSGELTSSSPLISASGLSSDAGSVVVHSISQLAKAAAFTTQSPASSEILRSGNLCSNWVNALTVSYGGAEYEVSLNKDSVSLNSDDSIHENLTRITDGLNDSVENIPGLSGHVKFSVSSTDQVVLENTDETKSDISVKEYSDSDSSGEKFLALLGLDKSGSGSEVTGKAVEEEISEDALDSTETTLGEILSGTTLTVSLDGLTKTISFPAGEEDGDDSYGKILNSSDPDFQNTGLAHFLQTQLDDDFGAGKITVSMENHQLRFQTADSSSGNQNTSVLQIVSSSSSDVLGENGALRIKEGETNRLETTETLDELSGELDLSPGEDGKYTITVNGKTLAPFSGSTELGTVLSTISSDPDAGVNLSYSQTADRFRITADDTGAQGKIAIKDAEGSGNLAKVLFGDTSGYQKGEDLKMNATLAGESVDITRSSNSFDLDGLELTVTGTTPDGVTDADIRFSPSGDTDDLIGKISGFVEEYNDLVEKANQYTSEMPYGLNAESGTNTKYGPLTDAQKKDMTDDEIDAWNEKAKQGLLQNDSTLNSILSDLREAVLENVDSAGLSLRDIGISTTSDILSGPKLVVDKTRLADELQSEPDRVSALFTGTDGISERIKQVINQNIGEFGNSGALIAVAGKDNMTGADNSLLSRQISDYESSVKTLETRLTEEKNHWLSKFTEMETKLGTLTSQYNYLSSMLSGGST